MLISGQWLGQINGTNTGMVIINLDFKDENYKGRVFIFDEKNVWIVANIEVIPISASSFNAALDHFSFLDPHLKLPLTQEETKHYPYILPQNGRCSIKLEENKLIGRWVTNIGTTGFFNVEQAPHGITNNDSNIFSWDQFKKYAQELNREQFIFRGQPNHYMLRTSYHRTKRSDLIRYHHEDIAELQRFLCSILNFYFDLENEKQYAALLHLAQHHGYPTPLLDWTYSPYIAAYFAFERTGTESEYVSIFQFDSKLWCNNPDNIQTKDIGCPAPSLTLLTPQPLFNNRAQPQQSVSMFSTIDGIQDWIFHQEEKHKNKYLKVIRLLTSERKVVLDDLYFMGINAGSLFPGLDGICKSLRDKNFNN